MDKAGYRKINDGSHSSSKYHKLDGTAARAIMKREAGADVEEGLEEGASKGSTLDGAEADSVVVAADEC